MGSVNMGLYEVMDRACMCFDHFYEALYLHPEIEADYELKKSFSETCDKLQGFYQKAASIFHVDSDERENLSNEYLDLEDEIIWGE